MKTKNLITLTSFFFKFFFFKRLNFLFENIKRFIECEMDSLEYDLKKTEKNDKFYNLNKIISGVVIPFLK